MKLLDLFAGIGGFSYAAHQLGWQTVAFVEKDKFCQEVLKKNFGQEIEIYDDIREFDGTKYAGAVDIVCGGFPCQDISIAGKHTGIEGERSALWSEMHRVIREIRPQFVVVENVAALLGRGMWKVLGDLSESGFDAEWGTFYGYDVGLPHKRERIFVIAYAKNNRCQYSEYGQSKSYPEPRFLKAISASGNVVSNKRRFLEEIRAAEFIRKANGIPKRVDRIKSLGNAIIPGIAFEIFKAIEQADNK